MTPLAIWILFLVVILIPLSTYYLGYSDGRMAEQEKQTFQRLDEAIAKVKLEAGGEK